VPFVVVQNSPLSLYYAANKIDYMSETTENLRRRALQARRENRFDDARRDLLEALTVCGESGDEIDLAETLTALGQIERDLYHADAALQYYAEATAIYRKGDDPLRLAHAVRHLADIHRHEGHLDVAEACYREALDIYRNHEKIAPLDLANAIRGYAIMKQETGATLQAELLWEEARKLYASVDVEAGVAESSRRLAAIANELPS
jgi:tetratricopeptide (TPR) repeat protein